MRFLTPLFSLVLAWLLLGIPARGGGGVSAGTAVRMDVGELVAASDLVVDARVLSERAFETGGRIETEYLLEVERTFVGQDLVHRSLRVPGGILPDGSGMVLAGMPRIRAGDHALFFLSPTGPNGIRMPVGLGQGKLDVVVQRSGEKYLVRDSMDLALVSPRTGRIVTGQGRSIRTYADVVAEIEAALARERAR